LTVAVLGTSFRITAWEKMDAAAAVKLFSGKVRVFETQNTGNGPHETAGIILQPGEQVVLNGSFITVSRFRQNDAQPLNTNFNNAPLADVLKTLSTLYRIRIDYNPADVAESRFTGNLNKNDQPDAVLSAIAKINALIVVRTIKGFSISRTAN
jgi:ferric-dicitrate binding protein FerR (iron transport regulator)